MDSKAALQPQRADSEARNPARRAGWFTKGNVLGVFEKTIQNMYRVDTSCHNCLRP